MAEEKVLVVDDDESVRKVLYRVITSNDMSCSLAASGEEALSLLNKEHFDLILMDIIMGKVDGFEVVQTVRKRGLSTPIIILSAKNEDYNAIFGLDIGADDYIVKPFNPIILGAKIKALIRRDRKSSYTNQNIVETGPFSYHFNSMKLYKSGEEIQLSSKENMLIKHFMEHVGQVFTKEQLYEAVWGNSIVDDNAIMVYISHLRNKIEDIPQKPKYIKTVWGIGYKFVCE